MVKLFPVGRRCSDDGFNGNLSVQQWRHRIALPIILYRTCRKHLARPTMVVYKVDRLSRSLIDFARIMEAFDKR